MGEDDWVLPRRGQTPEIWMLMPVGKPHGFPIGIRRQNQRTGQVFQVSVHAYTRAVTVTV
jgi:hypothetical protein